MYFLRDPVARSVSVRPSGPIRSQEFGDTCGLQVRKGGSEIAGFRTGGELKTDKNEPKKHQP